MSQSASANADAAAAFSVPESMNDADLQSFIALTHDWTGIQLDEQKRAMLYTRLTRRLREHRLSSFADYIDLLRNDRGEEREIFINTVTTNLTYFFREEHHFEFLRSEVLPALERRGMRSPVRIWSAGCSSGEEPYSIAMTLSEAGFNDAQGYRLLCTDLNTDMVYRTMQGEFRADSVRGLNETRQQTHFVQGQPGYIQANDQLRSSMICKQLNLFGDWPIRSGVDVIFCRNVLIYFNGTQQTQIVRGFARLQEEGAHLFLGHSEAVRDVSDFYKRVGNTVFRRTATPVSGR
ncbi:MAG: protein-glutamate O-methyltransferase CheR [Pseudomonadales bacterium]